MKKLIILLSISLLSFSCLRQVNQMRRFGECDFKYISVDSVMLAGVPMTKYSVMDNLSLLSVKNILNLFMKGTAPLQFKIYLQANNNRALKAAINQMEWQLYLDDKKVLDGINTERVEVPGHDSTVFHLNVELDVIQTLRIDNLNTMLDLTYSLLDVKKTGKNPIKPMQFKLMVRPSFKVGKKIHQYPNFITIYKDQINLQQTDKPASWK